jgi:hypothetical protein
VRLLSEDWPQRALVGSATDQPHLPGIFENENDFHFHFHLEGVRRRR